MQGLYAIVDPQACVREPLQVAQAILRGGCAALQLRDKQSDDRSFVRLGLSLAQACRDQRVPLILNDRFWLVREVSAQGAHVGQTDTPIEDVRRELGAAASIGLSTNSLEQACQAELRGADLIGFGPVFPTATKPGAGPVVGLVELAEVCARLTIPVVAIGGITLERAAGVARAGATMGAVISAICAFDDVNEIEASARALHQRLRQLADSPAV
jgi:thiamine-phosphate pyrophosphorylase